MPNIWLTLERWLLGTSRSPATNGVENSIQPTWSLSPYMAVVGVVVAAFIVLTIYWYESVSAGRLWKIVLGSIRTALIAVVVFMLYGWTIQRHRTDLSDVVVVLDDSASMGLVDTYADASLAAEIKRRLERAALTDPTRLNLAKTLLLENDAHLLAELGRRYNLRCYLAGASARAIAPQGADVASALAPVNAQQAASRLGNCVRELLETQRGRPTAAIIFLTDGLLTDGKSLTDAAQYARRKAVPLYFVGLGSDRPPRDLRLADLLADEAAFVGDLVHFDVKLIAEGLEGSAKVRLLRSGSDDVLVEETVPLDKGGTPRLIRLSHRVEQPGDFEYTAEVVPQEGETNVENNRLSRKVSVREETIRALLVQAYPNYEFRFLKQMLTRELNAHQPEDQKAVGVRTVLQEADAEYAQTDKTAQRLFPVSREELFEYDVLIFGDVNPALLSQSIMNNIYEFVTVRGGGVIFVAGPRYTPLAYRETPLAPLLPMNIDAVTVPDPDFVISESFRPRLTPLGRASPMLQLADTAAGNERLWREELAPLHWFAGIAALRPGVQVLAEHPTRRSDSGASQPIICLQFVGAGKVIFHATDETYRWRFRTGDTYFARYWVQTIRCLCRSKLLAGSRLAELTTDRAEYRSGDEVNLRVRFLDDRLAPVADDGTVVMLEHEGAERRSITLRRQGSRGIFEGSAGPLPVGPYRAWIAAPTSDMQPTPRQFSVVAPPGELARTQMDSSEMKEAARISVGKYYTFATANRLLSDLPRGRQVRIESLPPAPIWNVPLVAALFISLIAVEWMARKRMGLL